MQTFYTEISYIVVLINVFHDVEILGFQYTA